MGHDVISSSWLLPFINLLLLILSTLAMYDLLDIEHQIFVSCFDTEPSIDNNYRNEITFPNLNEFGEEALYESDIDDLYIPEYENHTTEIDSKYHDTATNEPYFVPPAFNFSAARVDHCLRLNLPKCDRKEPRDIIFMLDASESVDRNKFYTTTLDATRDIICAFDVNAPNQYSLVLFNGQVREAIPLAQYSHQEWENQVEMVRANQSSCCTCCTPFAEAFDLARQILQTKGKNSWSIVYAQTDGIPYQNTDKGNPYAFPKMNPAVYAMQQVPQSALLLKQMGARIMILGVQTEGRPAPDCDYFKGIPNKDLRKGKKAKNMQCIGRVNSDYRPCEEMKSPPFPIASLPLEKNSFCLTPIDEVLAATVESICLPPPPRSPTDMPTNLPTVLPTRRPTLSPTTTPTKTPTNAPTLKPTLNPTRNPTLSPTDTPTTNPSLSPSVSPTLAPTLKPTTNPTQTPTLRPSRNPTLHPTITPTRDPTQSPSQHPTLKPTTNPTPLPTQSPTPAPTPVPKFESLDLYFVIDRSGSIDDYYQFCSKVIRRSYFLPKHPNKNCWGIFLDFAESLSLEATKIGTQRPMKWKSDWPPEKNNAGLRVTVLAFSCKSDMVTPVTNIIVDGAESYDQLQQGLINGFSKLNVQGGTCPSEGIDYVVKQVEQTNHIDRPFKALIYLSDGMTSPSNEDKTIQSSKGLQFFNVITFAIGIAIPKGTRTFGLTPEEKAVQASQLAAITGNIQNRIIGLYDDNAFAALSIVYQDLSARITQEVGISELTFPIYCGYTTKKICEQNLVNCQWTNLGCNKRGSSTLPFFTIYPTNSPTSRSTTKAPVKPPVSFMRCDWPLFMDGMYVAEGAVEATPTDLCSSKKNKFGCESRNYCCWNDVSSTCSMPPRCKIECPTAGSENICNANSDCCSWSSNQSTCVRKCIGSTQSVCTMQSSQATAIASVGNSNSDEESYENTKFVSQGQSIYD